MKNVESIIREFESEFKFKYVGGGYFRDSSVPKGTKSETVHGDEIVEKFVTDLIARLKTSDNLLT